MARRLLQPLPRHRRPCKKAFSTQHLAFSQEPAPSSRTGLADRSDDSSATSVAYLFLAICYVLLLRAEC